MIHGQILATFAILAPESIPPENVFSRNHDPLVRNTYVCSEPHNTGKRILDRRRPDVSIRYGLDEFGFLQEDQHHRTLDAACRQCAVVVVEYEYVTLHDGIIIAQVRRRTKRSRQSHRKRAGDAGRPVRSGKPAHETASLPARWPVRFRKAFASGCRADFSNEAGNTRHRTRSR